MAFDRESIFARSVLRYRVADYGGAKRGGGAGLSLGGKAVAGPFDGVVSGNDGSTGGLFVCGVTIGVEADP